MRSLQWIDGLDDEDLAFIQRFILASGSLKDTARAYGVSYPTVRLRLDRLIAKVQVLGSDQEQSPFERLVRSKYAEGKIDLIRQAVEIAKDHGVPSGVGAHDLRVVVECEKNNIPNDFYIKTFHHHNYASGPKPEQLKTPYSEIPGYWCKDPAETIEVMKNVTKPWIAFKVMAAGAIPPADAFRYVFENGADHTLAGMFDFEIAEDVLTANAALKEVKRARAWKS